MGDTPTSPCPSPTSSKNPSTAGARSARDRAPRRSRRGRPYAHKARGHSRRRGAHRAQVGRALPGRGTRRPAPTFSPSPPPRAARRGSQASGASARRLREMNGGEERAGVRRGRSLQRSTMGRVALSSVCCNSVRSECAPGPARGEPGGSGREEGAPDPLDSPEHGAVHSGRRPCDDRSMKCKSKRATTGEDRMSGRSPSRRLQPSACAPSLPRSKRAGARPSESHFNPTLSHFIPLSVPLCGPNPTESRRIPTDSGVQVFFARVPG